MVELSCSQANDDRQTDGQTDGQTDRRTFVILESLSRVVHDNI